MALLLENNVKTAIANYVDKGKISKEDFEKILSFDRTPTKKFTFWMVKQYVAGGGSLALDQIRNITTEYISFLTRGLVDTASRDINSFPTFSALEEFVNKLNNTPGVKSNVEHEKEKTEENDYEIGVDNQDIVVTVPHTHAASRKLGLKYFQVKKSGGGTSDVPWCTSYANNTHYNSYYSRQFITFYYVLCKGACAAEIVKTLGTPGAGLASKYLMVALVVKKDGSMDAYDATDHEFSNTAAFKSFLKIIYKYIPADAPMRSPEWQEKASGSK